MTELRENGILAHAVFAGLTPTSRVDGERPVRQDAGRLSRGVMTTGAIMLAGAVTVAMHVTGPVEAYGAPVKKKPLPGASTGPAEGPSPGGSHPAVAALAGGVPSTHTVKAGDTVSRIASRYGLSTASVLTLNGLSWSSLIFPGQVLKLTKSPTARSAAAAPKVPATSPSSGVTSYTVKSGDTISGIAGRYGVSTQKVLDANGLKWSSIIRPGQRIEIPGTTGAPASEGSPTLEVEEIASSTPPASSYHIVRAGETISGIAARYGVSTEKVLRTNGLKLSSIIYPGQKVRIPGTAAGGTVAKLNSEQTKNARIVIEVGRSLGVPDRGIVIALAAAMQESGLKNIAYGDRDSIGLFQQRPSAGWGTPERIMDPKHAARLFYGGPKNPNKGATRGLLDIRGWQSMSVTQAAQAVQISAYPDAYAKWEASASAWLDLLG